MEVLLQTLYGHVHIIANFSAIILNSKTKSRQNAMVRGYPCRCNTVENIHGVFRDPACHMSETIIINLR